MESHISNVATYEKTVDFNTELTLADLKILEDFRNSYISEFSIQACVEGFGECDVANNGSECCSRVCEEGICMPQ